MMRQRPLSRAYLIVKGVIPCVKSVGGKPLFLVPERRRLFSSALGARAQGAPTPAALSWPNRRFRGSARSAGQAEIGATPSKSTTPQAREPTSCACLEIRSVKHGGGLARFYRGRLSCAGGGCQIFAAAAILAGIKERSARPDRFAGRIAWSSARSHAPPSAEHNRGFGNIGTKSPVKPSLV